MSKTSGALSGGDGGEKYALKYCRGMAVRGEGEGGRLSTDRFGPASRSRTGGHLPLPTGRRSADWSSQTGEQTGHIRQNMAALPQLPLRQSESRLLALQLPAHDGCANGLCSGSDKHELI